MSEIVRRLRVATGLLVLTVLAGTVGIHWLGHGRWGWFESLFHTLITLSTVGYGELPGMDHDVPARVFSLVLIVMGTGSVVYFASVVTALVVEGELRHVFRGNRMRKAIDQLQRHVIVCGVGRTGQYVVDELTATKTPFVAVDRDEGALLRLKAQHPHLLYIIGDAAEDEVLQSAGITRAKGVVAALSDDRDNVYVSLSARALNPSLRIIAKAIEPHAEPKLRKAGADKVVSTHMIGGMRLASEMIRPNATAFLDIMLRDPAHVLRIEEATVTAASAVVGKTIAQAGLRKICNVLVVAVRSSEGAHSFNPGGETVLSPGATLIVMGDPDEVGTLRAALSPSTP